MTVSVEAVLDAVAQGRMLCYLVGLNIPVMDMTGVRPHRRCSSRGEVSLHALAGDILEVLNQVLQ